MQLKNKKTITSRAELNQSPLITRKNSQDISGQLDANDLISGTVAIETQKT